MLDRRLVTALHVETLRRSELHAEHEPHVLFQASTIGALLDGAYDGDVTFAELAEHGDLGLGTLNALDGEMIALDGRFYRADVDGGVTEIDPARRTPFAVMSWFDPSVEFDVTDPLDDEAFLALLDRRIPAGAASCALRVDGEFGVVRGRSVPAQTPPYRPLAEVIGDQHVFELRRHRRVAGRVPVPRVRRGRRGERVPPPLHLRRPHRRRPRPRVAGPVASTSGSIRPRVFMSSCRPESISPGRSLPDHARRASPRRALGLGD